MIILEDYLGIEIDDNYNLRIDGYIVKPSIRKKSEMKDVLLEYDGKEENLYYMYRGVFRREDRKIFEKYRIRHDITLIPNKIVGIEYNKTYGHYHPNNYAELYEVIRGEAIFIMQSRDFRNLILVKAKRGDQVLILPGYGHVTVNIGNEPLIMSNLVYWDFESDYSIFKEKRGALVYITKDGIKINENYLLEVKNIDFGNVVYAKRIFDRNIYEEFVSNPDKFMFLKEKFNI